MSARDKYHEAAKQALIRDGWTITHDPYRLTIGKRRRYIDLGAEMPIAAEKGGRCIVVEIKSFLGLSELNDFENAIGQFGVYRVTLQKRDPERLLYLALPDDVRGFLLEESDFSGYPTLVRSKADLFRPRKGDHCQMDRDDSYRAAVRRVLQEVADMTPSEEKIRTEFVADDILGHYQVGQVGWDGKRRVDDVFLHVDVIEGKVWLQHDGTNLRIAEDLIRAGIPKEHIVLAFHHPARRLDTDFAAA